MGSAKNYSPSVINQISTIQENDLIAFIGLGKSFPGRVNLKEWMKRSFKGYFEDIRVFRITKGYFYDDKKIIWSGNGKWKDEIFPHRFEFDPTPIIHLRNIQIKNLAETSKRELHSMVYGNLISANPSTLVNIIYYGQHP